MYGHWNIDAVGEFDSSNYFGFIYLIRHKETQRKYIGKKQFRFKKCLRLPGRINRKITYKESDWQTYTSSSDLIHLDVKLCGKEAFSFEIIKLCETKRDLTYSEVEEQFLRNVLFARLENGEREYYNKNILSRFFACTDHTEETKKKIGNVMSGEGNPRYGSHLTDATKTKISKSKLGSHHTEETKQLISESTKGKITSEETKEKMSDAAHKLWDDPEKSEFRRQAIIEFNIKTKTGSKQTPEAKEKIRNSLLGKKRGPYKKKGVDTPLTFSTMEDIVSEIDED